MRCPARPLPAGLRACLTAALPADSCQGPSASPHPLPFQGDAIPSGDTRRQHHPSPLPTGGFLCLTTRSNPSNLRYKVELEAVLERLERQGAWQKVLAQEVERWERATSEEESTQGTGYISGVVYIYQKCPIPPLEEG